MTLDWEPQGDEAPGSLQSFGRQLRDQFGGASAGLDSEMIRLLEQLFEVPAISRSEGE
jgi:hypothetical protein